MTALNKSGFIQAQDIKQARLRIKKNLYQDMNKRNNYNGVYTAVYTAVYHRQVMNGPLRSFNCLVYKLFWLSSSAATREDGMQSSLTPVSSLSFY